MSEIEFRHGDKISKEEFLSQFGDESAELVIKVFLAWKKYRQFPKIGDEYLANIEYDIPWENKAIHIGFMGFIYWYCKKRAFGFPYPPKFKEDCFYRVRVKKCLYSPNTYLLEEVLASDIRPEDDSSIYDKVVSGCLDEYETSPEEITVYTERSVNVSTEIVKYKGVVGICSCPVICPGADGAHNVTEGMLTILHDNKQFKHNRHVVLKKGTVYRLLVRRRKNSEKTYLLERILETNVKDTALRTMGDSIINDSIWSVEGVGDLIIRRRNGHSEATTDIIWKTVKTENGDVARSCGISLACDEENPLTAVKSTEILKKILSNKAAWEKKIYDYIADENIGDDGTIETWEGEGEGSGIHITREEFTDRLCISYINIDEDDLTDISVDMDGMFYDHSYGLCIDSDGTISSNGLEE